MPELDENKPIPSVGGSETFNAGPKIDFPNMVRIEPCSYNQCANGHKWPPQLAVGQCPGCGGPFLAVRMINCPQCNEPTQSIQLRTDHTCPGMGIAAVCKQQAGLAEVTYVRMDRKHSEECMAKWDEKTGRMQV